MWWCLQLETGRIDIFDDELRRQLELTKEDLRFADHIIRHVIQERTNTFLDGVGWDGGDDWLRAEFKSYLLFMLRTSLLDGNIPYIDFHLSFRFQIVYFSYLGRLVSDFFIVIFLDFSWVWKLISKYFKMSVLTNWSFKLLIERLTYKILKNQEENRFQLFLEYENLWKWKPVFILNVSENWLSKLFSMMHRSKQENK